MGYILNEDIGINLCLYKLAYIGLITYDCGSAIRLSNCISSNIINMSEYELNPAQQR